MRHRKVNGAVTVRITGRRSGLRDVSVIGNSRVNWGLFIEHADKLTWMEDVIWSGSALQEPTAAAVRVGRCGFRKRRARELLTASYTDVLHCFYPAFARDGL